MCDLPGSSGNVVREKAVLSGCNKVGRPGVSPTFPNPFTYANVAQMVEQLTRNEQVTGSSPVVGSETTLLLQKPNPESLSLALKGNFTMNRDHTAMALKEVAHSRILDTSAHDLIGDFFVPMLRASTRYDRGVGYFSSGWFRAAAAGMVEFAANAGRARWITSPILSEKDWKALQEGEAARNDAILRDTLRQNVADLAEALERQTLSALAWMVADGILEFKLALPYNKLNSGDFHTKFGIFSDSVDDSVSFSGSYNDSIQGLRNYENISIFCSWESSFVEWVFKHQEQFEKLWNNEDPNVRVFDLPAAAHAQIIDLRTQGRPYAKPPWMLQYVVDVAASGLIREQKPYTLWEHQRKAIEQWEGNDRVGILSMATGSGKTLTALAAASHCVDLNLLLIAAPRKNLVDQWKEEVERFTNFPEPLLIYKNASSWQDRLFSKLRAGHRNGWPQPLVLIGSLQSLGGSRFQSVLDDAGIPEQSLIIVDEVHNVGAPTYQKIMNTEYTWRLGLSATPERHYDEEGTGVIMEYFEKAVFSYTMEQALKDDHLTPYAYHVYAAHLSEEEYEYYLKLTRQILAARGQSEDATVTMQTNNRLDGDQPGIEQLLFRRAGILKKAVSKTDVIQQVLQDHPPERSLIYCADREQLEDVGAVLSTANIPHLKYIGETPMAQRHAALDGLASGDVPVLVAIDCLDEGVDVPAVDAAIILASSTNDRQFIQRRGRVLRKYSNKVRAKLIDIISLPPTSVGQDGRWMLQGELERAKKMAKLADNRHEALVQIKSYTGALLTELL